MKKRILTIIICLILIGATIFYLDKITNRISSYFNGTPKVSLEKKNQYAKEKSYAYVQITDNYVPYNYQELLNVLYTTLDAGYDRFTFYCPKEYQTCIEDVKEIANSKNKEVLTTIGNFVHPYNNFTSLKVITASLGEVTIKVEKTYTKEKIDAINTKMDQIIKENTDPNSSIEDKVLKIHDYIINNTVYDMNDETANSGDAYGALFDGKAKCAGYADAMAIALDKLGVQNYKVASEEHVWNAVYINGKWKHLDLTWDDPVVTNGANITDTIRHKFYMIDTPTLLSYDTKEHSFDKSVYVEVNS